MSAPVFSSPLRKGLSFILHVVHFLKDINYSIYLRPFFHFFNKIADAQIRTMYSLCNAFSNPCYDAIQAASLKGLRRNLGRFVVILPFLFVHYFNASVSFPL